MQRPDELEDELLGIVDLLKKVDIGAHRPAEAHLEREAVAFSLRELPRDVAVGDEDVLRDEPAGADPIELRARQIDATDRRDRDVEQGLGLGQPLPPDLAVGLVDENKPGVIVADRQHRALGSHGDAFQDEHFLGRLGRRRFRDHRLEAAIAHFLREFRIVFPDKRGCSGAGGQVAPVVWPSFRPRQVAASGGHASIFACPRKLASNQINRSRPRPGGRQGRISVAFRLSSGSSSNGLWDLDSGRALGLDAFVRGRPGEEAGIVEFDYDPPRTIYREKIRDDPTLRGQNAARLCNSGDGA